MAKKGPNDSVFADIAKEFVVGDANAVANVVDFIEKPWGLGINLYPGQKLILKTYYGLPLDNTKSDIEIRNEINDRVLFTCTESEFMDWMISEGKTNLTKYVPGKERQELVLVCGRRGGKCRHASERIDTTCGNFTLGELLEKKHNNPDIGILTYDPETLKSSITKDFQIWDNGKRDCGKITTKMGLEFTTSWNHPYLVWRDDSSKPEWIDLSELKKGDRIATAKDIPLFGQESIGIDRAKILGYLMGDGGITHYVIFTTESDTYLEEFTSAVEKEFPSVSVKKRAKYQYGVSKLKLGKRKNSVEIWLRDIGCFGKKSVDKEIPECIHKAPKEEVAAFLSRLFACDGWACVESNSRGRKRCKGSIGYGSSSKKLALGVLRLLQKFGVHASLRHKIAKCEGKEFDAWSVDIVSKDSVLAFNEQIGIYGKEEQVNRVVANLSDKDSYGYLNTLPKGMWKYIDGMQSKNCLLNSDVVGNRKGRRDDYRRLRKDYAPSKDKVSSYASNCNDQFMMDMANSDVTWDVVESVEDVGKHRTIDLCVENTHIIGGSIITHNSILGSAIACYEIYRLIKMGNPQAFFSFPPGQDIRVTCCATDDDQASIPFVMMRNGIESSAYLRDRVCNDTQKYFNIQTDEDIKNHGRGTTNKASVTIRAGGSSAKALRGGNSIMVIFDEMAFFINNDGRFSGGEVYRALSPQVISFKGHGKVVSSSSPHIRSGQFFELYEHSFNSPDNMIMFQMYSSLMNPEVDSDYLKSQRKKSKLIFNSEFGANFNDQVSVWIDDPEVFDDNYLRELGETRGRSDIEYFYGIDYGAKEDGTAIVISHYDPEEDRIVIDYSDVFYSGSSPIWEMEGSMYQRNERFKIKTYIGAEDVVQVIVELLRWFPSRAGVFDHWNGITLKEQFEKRDLYQFDSRMFSPKIRSDEYSAFQLLYREGKLDLYRDMVLDKEIKSLECENLGQNKISVDHSNVRGAHNDLVEAMVRSVSLCMELSRTKARKTSAAKRASTKARMLNPVTGLGKLQSFQRMKESIHGEAYRPTSGSRHPAFNNRRYR